MCRQYLHHVHVDVDFLSTSCQVHTHLLAPLHYPPPTHGSHFCKLTTFDVIELFSFYGPPTLKTLCDLTSFCKASLPSHTKKNKHKKKKRNKTQEGTQNKQKKKRKKRKETRNQKMEKKTVQMEIGRNKKVREKMVTRKGEAGRRRDKQMKEVGDRQEGGFRGCWKSKKKLISKVKGHGEKNTSPSKDLDLRLG